MSVAAITKVAIMLLSIKRLYFLTGDLERLTGMSDAKIEGLITNRNHDDNLTTERLQDQRVHFNDLAQEGWGPGQ